MTTEAFTRREVLKGIAAASLLPNVPGNQPSAPDICFLSAVEMAQLIRAKKLSAREALAAHLKQIERVNPKVNAIVTLVPEMAQEAAAKADEIQAHGETLGPLHGLPVAHKDLIETRGIRTTFGSPLFKDYIPTEDNIVVERMNRAGNFNAIIAWARSRTDARPVGRAFRPNASRARCAAPAEFSPGRIPAARRVRRR